MTSTLPLLLSVLLGLGVYLVYDGFTRKPTQRPAERGWEARMRDNLVRAGLYDVTPRDFLLFAIGSGAVFGLVTQLLLGWPLVAFLATLLGVAAPVLYYSERYDRRRAALQVALAEAIAQLRDSIRSGLSVQEALLGLARNGPQPLRAEFGALVREARLIGFEPALRTMRDRLADPVFDIVAGALVMNDRVGGRNVTQVLDRLAQATWAQQHVHQEQRALQARNVLSARIVAAVPVIVLMAIRWVSPEYLALFDGFLGQLALVGCLASVAVGYFGMRWMANVPGEERVLVR
ncbi:MAG: type II secretion system F family protein [Chloroflexi bacterium]|nr:type II secretion system F family protein [Chloroflexota bacterium]MBV9543224.1 type II secretion system F family protein [Chloroflexota bacterium]